MAAYAFITQLVLLRLATAVAAAEPCLDLYTGDCNEDLEGGCLGSFASVVCQKTCDLCPTEPPPTTSTQADAAAELCVDLYTGDCREDLEGGCQSAFASVVCQKTCDLCPTQPPLTTSTEAASTATTTDSACVDIYIGDCARDFETGCDHSFVQLVCSKTCQQCSETPSFSVPVG